MIYVKFPSSYSRSSFDCSKSSISKNQAASLVLIIHLLHHIDPRGRKSDGKLENTLRLETQSAKFTLVNKVMARDRRKPSSRDTVEAMMLMVASFAAKEVVFDAEKIESRLSPLS